MFTTTPGRGHVYPMVPLARAFADQGHEVLWAAADGVCARLRADGFEAVAAGLGEDDGFPELHRRFPEIAALPAEERPDVMFPRLFGAVRAPPMLADLLPLVRRWRPSLLVSEQAELAGPVAAAAVGVPCLAHAFGSLLPAARLAAAGEQVAPLWEGCGLAPRPFAGTYDHLYLDIYPPSLQDAETGHVPAVQPLRPVAFAGASGEDGPVWPDPGSTAPLVYVTFGTVFTKDLTPIATVVRALRGLPVRVLVTLGPGRDPRALGDQPPNVLVAAFIPQTRILPHCAAVVSHGGSGTFLAALASGLPQLLLPQAADQFRNAAAGVRSGAALAIPPAELTAGRVQEAGRRLLADPAPRAAAQRLAAEIRSMPAPDVVVEHIVGRFSAGAPALT